MVVPDECRKRASIRPIVGRLGNLLDLLPHRVGVAKTILSFVTAYRMMGQTRASQPEEWARPAPRDTSSLWGQLGNANVPA